MYMPSGTGKTLIANMLVEAYQQRNPKKLIVFIVSENAMVSEKQLLKLLRELIYHLLLG